MTINFDNFALKSLISNLKQPNCSIWAEESREGNEKHIFSIVGFCRRIRDLGPSETTSSQQLSLKAWLVESP